MPATILSHSTHPTPWPCPDHPPCPSTSRRPIQGGSACATVAAAVSVISSSSSAKSVHWSSPVQRNRQSHRCYVTVKRAGLGHQAQPKQAAFKSQPSARQSIQHVHRSSPVQRNRQGRVTNKMGRLASDTTWAVCFLATQSERAALGPNYIYTA